MLCWRISWGCQTHYSCAQFPPSCVATVNFNYHSECCPEYAPSERPYRPPGRLKPPALLHACWRRRCSRNHTSICAHAMSWTLPRDRAPQNPILMRAWWLTLRSLSLTNWRRRCHDDALLRSSSLSGSRCVVAVSAAAAVMSFRHTDHVSRHRISSDDGSRLTLFVGVQKLSSSVLYIGLRVLPPGQIWSFSEDFWYTIRLQKRPRLQSRNI